MDILDNLLVKDDVIQITQLSVILVLSTFLFLCVFGKKQKFSIGVPVCYNILNSPDHLWVV